MSDQDGQDGLKTERVLNDSTSAVFQNTKTVYVYDSNFALNLAGGQTRGDSDLMQNLLRHISTDAMHSSQELKRSREINHVEIDALVHDWSRFEIMPTSTFARVTADDALRDIFKWLHDHLTSVLVMWMHAESRTETLFTAYALANILHQRRDLAASFFVSQNPEVDCASVVPTIAYQLAQSMPHTKEFISRATQDNIIFTSANREQVSKLIVEPLRMASELGRGSPTAHKLILIHGLEDCKDEDFVASLVDNLSRALASMETTTSPPRLLFIGRYTSHLQECFSRLVSSSTFSGKIVLRPIQLHHWLGKEHAIFQKMRELELRENNLSTMLDDVITERAAAGQTLRMAKAHQEKLRENLKEFEQKKAGQLGEELNVRARDLEERERKLKAAEEELVAMKRNIDGTEKALRAREAELDVKVSERQLVLKGKEEQLKVKELELMKREKLLGFHANGRRVEGDTADPISVLDLAHSQRLAATPNEKAPKPKLQFQNQSVDIQTWSMQMQINALEEEIKRRGLPISNTGSSSNSQHSSHFGQQAAVLSPPYTSPLYDPSSSPVVSQSWRSPSPTFETHLAPSGSFSPDPAMSSYLPSWSPSQKLPFNYMVSPPPRVSPVLQSPQALRSNSPRPSPNISRASSPHVKESRPYLGLPEI